MQLANKDVTKQIESDMIIFGDLLCITGCDQRG